MSGVSSAASDKSAEWKARQTCYHCNKVGHIKLDCADRMKPGESSVKKLGASMKFNGVSNSPYLAVNLWGGTGTPQRVLRMAAYCDSGAEVNVVGKNWISYLELHGAAIENVTTIELQWLDRKVTVQVSQAMKLSVQIAGCNKICEVKFFWLHGI